jgi:hypothetical protein
MFTRAVVAGPVFVVTGAPVAHIACEITCEPVGAAVAEPTTNGSSDTHTCHEPARPPGQVAMGDGAQACRHPAAQQALTIRDVSPHESRLDLFSKSITVHMTTSCDGAALEISSIDPHALSRQSVVRPLRI